MHFTFENCHKGSDSRYPPIICKRVKRVSLGPIDKKKMAVESIGSHFFTKTFFRELRRVVSISSHPIPPSGTAP